MLTFEVSKGEQMYACEPSHDEAPERIYERRSARTLLDCVVNKLRDEFIVHARASVDQDGRAPLICWRADSTLISTSVPIPFDPAPATTLEYDSFGPYRILGVLCEGGLGTTLESQP
jgi:hypothetical protein